MEMLPSFSPIGRNTLFNPFGTLGRCHENAILSPSNKIPTALAPFIGFFDKEIRGEAELYK